MTLSLVIIGLGNHTKNKLIPTLEELTIPIKGIVSQSKISSYKNIKVYKNVESVLQLHKITHVIISTIPTNQIKYIKKLATRNVKIFIEKPAFIRSLDLYSVKKLISDYSLLTEGMMYRFGEGFNFFNKALENIKDNNFEISLDFILPNTDGIFPHSFRQDTHIKNSILYDIGPYIFDFLWVLKFLKFKIHDLQVDYFKNMLIKKLKFKVSSNEQKLNKINVNIGYDNYYNNKLEFYSKKQCFTISPFFWGRKGIIEVIVSKCNGEKKIKISTESSLKILLYKWFFEYNDGEINELQSFERYKFIISKLEILENEVLGYV